MSAPTVTACQILINLPQNSIPEIAATAPCGNQVTMTIISTLGDQTVLYVCNTHGVNLIETGQATQL